jgi:hypothetical protein
MPKCGVLNEPALSIISKHFETFDERGDQMVPTFFYIKLKVNFSLPKPIKIKEKMQPK